MLDKQLNIHFVDNLKKYLIISGAVFIIGIIMTCVFGPVLDVQFKGGTVISCSYEGEIDNSKVGSVVEKAINKKVSVTESSDISGESKMVVITLADNKALDSESMDAVEKALSDNFKDNKIKIENKSSVSPTVGVNFFLKSLYTVMIAAVLVIVYVGWRFRKIGGLTAGITALAALFHDILIAFFVCVIFRLQINDNFIAVILTLLGYSLNDTIVIYDRIRENRNVYGGKMPLADLVDKSCNQVAKRTIVTSVTTFSAILTVAIVAELNGLDTLRSFSIPMCLGIVSGSYSSICLSPALWVKWQERIKRKEEAKKSYSGKKSK